MQHSTDAIAHVTKGTSDNQNFNVSEYRITSQKLTSWRSPSSPTAFSNPFTSIWPSRSRYNGRPSEHI